MGSERFTRISIFLSPWDDHTQLSPISGRVEEVLYTPGKFGLALFKKNLRKNENNLIRIAGEKVCLAVRQISGRIVRRILCDCRAGDLLAREQKLGAIRFGSCVQLYLPVGTLVEIREGQKVLAGRSIIGRFES